MAEASMGSLEDALAQVDLNRKSRSARSRLLELPAELRLQIFEYIYTLPVSTTVVDLRNPTSNPHWSVATAADALEMTSKQLREECTALRRFRFLAPIFGESGCASGPLFEEQKRTIARRLKRIAANESRARLMSKAVIHMGDLGDLERLRWTEMFKNWSSVFDSVVSLRERAPGLKLSWEASAEGGTVVLFQFGIKTPQEVFKGMENGCCCDGSPAVLTSAEAGKVQKIKATLVKTLFPSEKAGASLITPTAFDVHTG